jgi:hypothetical protein
MYGSLFVRASLKFLLCYKMNSLVTTYMNTKPKHIIENINLFVCMFLCVLNLLVLKVCGTHLVMYSRTCLPSSAITT